MAKLMSWFPSLLQLIVPSVPSLNLNTIVKLHVELHWIKLKFYGRFPLFYRMYHVVNVKRLFEALLNSHLTLCDATHPMGDWRLVVDSCWAPADVTGMCVRLVFVGLIWKMAVLRNSNRCKDELFFFEKQKKTRESWYSVKSITNRYARDSR